MALARAIGLLLGVEGQHGHDRAENLLAHDAVLVGAAVEDRGRDEPAAVEAVPRHTLAATEQARAAGHAARDMGQHLLHMRLRNQRAHLRRGVERIAEHDLRRALHAGARGISRFSERWTKTRVPLEQTSPAE